MEREENIKNIMHNIKQQLKDYKYLFLSKDLISKNMYNYSFIVSINFNSNFNDDLTIKIFNRLKRLLIQKTFKPDDFKGMENFLNNFENKI